MKYILSDREVKVIQQVLNKDDRVELIPAKNGEIKVVHIRRKEIKTREQ